jgi:hypothetical protein
MDLARVAFAGELSASIQQPQPKLLWQSRLIAAGKPLPHLNRVSSIQYLSLKAKVLETKRRF